jgi:hypothetical protein
VAAVAEDAVMRIWVGVFDEVAAPGIGAGDERVCGVLAGTASGTGAVSVGRAVVMAATAATRRVVKCMVMILVDG